MEKGMKKRKKFVGFLHFRKKTGEKLELGIEKWGTLRVQSRWIICLIYALWSAFKCVENREI